MLPIRRLVYVWSPGHGSLPRCPRWRTGLAMAISIGPTTVTRPACSVMSIR
jgi:hypothetical protein